MKKRKKKDYFLKVIFFILVLSILLNAYLLIPKPVTKEEIDINGFDKVKIELTGVTILLSKGCYVLPIYVSLDQAASIKAGMINEQGFRPNTHDLMASVLYNSEVEVLGVKITELKDNAYHAKLAVRSNGKVKEVDSRPSDAIAVAVRAGAEVYINKDLLRNYGIDTCEGEEVEIRDEEMSL